MINIYPTILTDSLETVQEQVDLVKNLPEIKTIQIDIIDGFFVDNLTITPMDLVEVNLGKLQVDFHLMTEEPLAFAEEIINFQAHLPVRAVIGQVEKMTSQVDFIDLLEKFGLKKGLSLNLFTPDEEILDSLFKRLDVLQLLAVEAGDQGRAFDRRVLTKIDTVKDRARHLNPNLEIMIDGGIDEASAPLLKQHGIESWAVGSALWESSDIKQTVESLIHAR